MLGIVGVGNVLSVRRGTSTAKTGGGPAEIVTVSNHVADIRIYASGLLPEPEHMVDEFNPKPLVGTAVAGPCSRDRCRNRSIILDSASPQLCRKWVRRLGDPAEYLVVVDCVTPASGQCQLAAIASGGLKQDGVVVGTEEANPPVAGRRPDAVDYVVPVVKTHDLLVGRIRGLEQAGRIAQG